MNHLFGWMLAVDAVRDVDPACDLAGRGINDCDGTGIEIGNVGLRVAQNMHVTWRGEASNGAGYFGSVTVDSENNAGIIDDHINGVAV